MPGKLISHLTYVFNLLLVIVKRDLSVSKRGPILITVTPVSIVFGGHSYRCFDSWSRTTGKICTNW